MSRRTTAIALLLPLLATSLIRTMPARGADHAPAARASPLAHERDIPLPNVTGGMNHLAADAKRQRLFVTATDLKSVVVVDLKADRVLRTLKVPGAAAAAFAEDQNQLCVSGGGAITVYDGDSFEMLGQIDLHHPVDELRYDPHRHLLYAGLTDQAHPAIAAIDLPSRKLVGEVALPAKPQGIDIDPEGNRLFANTPGAKQVTVVDLRQMKVVASWPLTEAQSNYPLALDPQHHRLFVACRRPAVVLVLDDATGKPVAHVESVGDADDMGYDPPSGLALVAGGDGAVAVLRQLDPDHYQKLDAIHTSGGARNAVLVSPLRRFFVVLPADGQQPMRVAVYRIAP